MLKPITFLQTRSVEKMIGSASNISNLKRGFHLIKYVTVDSAYKKIIYPLW